MIAVEQASPVLLAVLLLSLLAAAAVDIRSRRVPNLLVAAVALSGIAAFATTGNAALLWQPVLVALAILLVGTPLFARGWVGGGDIKLLAAAACWFTAKGALQFVAAALLAGGALAVVYLGSQIAFAGRGSRHVAGGLPYAIAIACGAALQVVLYRL